MRNTDQAVTYTYTFSKFVKLCTLFPISYQMKNNGRKTLTKVDHLLSPALMNGSPEERRNELL